MNIHCEERGLFHSEVRQWSQFDAEGTLGEEIEILDPVIRVDGGLVVEAEDFFRCERVEGRGRRDAV